MAGTLTRGYTFGASEEVTAAKLHALVDDGTISGITAEDMSSGTIADDLISSVGGNKFTNLANIPSGAGKIPAANLTDNTSSVISAAYPVGSIYLSTVSTNPATLLGIGTWVAFGAGRMLLGNGGGYTAGATGGAATHTLTTNEMPAHTHSGVALAPPASSPAYGDGVGGPFTKAGSTNSTGGGAAHNNMPPYLVIYMWNRTA
jgi:hypothetical protein